MEEKKPKSTRQKKSPKFMEKLKVERLCLINKYFKEDLNLIVEVWIGETEKEYIAVEIASDPNGEICSSIGSINERESRVYEDRQILLTETFPFDIFHLAKYLKWNLKNSIIEEAIQD